MSSKKPEPRVNSGKTKNDGNVSHHDIRPQSGSTAKQPSGAKEKNENEAAPKVSPNAKPGARPKTSHSSRNPSITQPSRPNSADTQHARGIVKGEKPVDLPINVLENDTKNGALENKKAEWEKGKIDLQGRRLDHLEKENQILKSLLGDLHMYVTSDMDINFIPLELSSVAKHFPPLESVYPQAQAIYNKLKEMKELESERESVDKQLFELLLLILGDRGQQKMVTTGRKKRTRSISQSLLKRRDSHKENFQLAVSALGQMKQRAQELDQSQAKWEEYCKQLTEKHSKEKEKLLDIIKSLTVEKENLMTRLSTIAADRLMHGNVNIADLSDADRPTKLSEVYSELYDNEWTDAFEELTSDQNISDKDAIMVLLKILMSSFQNCREITWGRYERLLHVASSIDIEQRNSLSSDKKVMSNVSKPSLTTQEAQSSRAQLDKNDKKEDQNGSNKHVEMADPGMNAASQDEFANEKEKNFPMDKNVDIVKEGTASSEGGEKKEMQIDEKENKEHDGKEVVKSGDPEGSGASEDKSESVNGKA